MAKDKRKPIVELDKPNGKVTKYWESTKDASLFYGIHPVNISQNVTGCTKSAKGHYFRYATYREIADYNKIIAQTPDPIIDQPTTIDDKTANTDAPVITIPETIQPTEDQQDTTSNFARLLEESKKKFQKNSK